MIFTMLLTDLHLRARRVAWLHLSSVYRCCGSNALPHLLHARDARKWAHVKYLSAKITGCIVHVSQLTEGNQEDVVHERTEVVWELKGHRTAKLTQMTHRLNYAFRFHETQRTTVGFFSPSVVAIPVDLAWLFPSSNSEVVSSDDWRCPIVNAQVPRCYLSICRQLPSAWTEEMILNGHSQIEIIHDPNRKPNHSPFHLPHKLPYLASQMQKILCQLWMNAYAGCVSRECLNNCPLVQLFFHSNATVWYKFTVWMRSFVETELCPDKHILE